MKEADGRYLKSTAAISLSRQSLVGLGVERHIDGNASFLVTTLYFSGVVTIICVDAISAYT